MASIVITGSRGFIGTVLRTECLVGRDYAEVDLSFGKDHKNLTDGQGTLIFLSSWIREAESYNDPVKYIENNLGGLAAVLSQNLFKRVIFPSSYAVYDAKGELNPRSVYGITKLAGEHLMKAYIKDVWILRLGNPYGKGDRGSVFFQLAECKREDRSFTLYESNGQRKDFFHVSGLVNIVNNILDGTLDPGTYNVGTGEGLEVSSTLTTICQENAIRNWKRRPPPGLSVGYIPNDNLLQVPRGELISKWSEYYL